MMTLDTMNHVRESYKLLVADGEKLAELFFDKLFAKEPSLRAMLPKDEWMRTRDLLTGLGTLVKNLHRLSAINHVLMDFGAQAQRQGVLPQHYGLARGAMIETMAELMGEQWNDELELDWTETLNTVTSVVLLGAGRARAKAA
jgi:nitric oxide dioxygenase